MATLNVPLKRDGGLWLSAPAEDHHNLVWTNVSEFTAEMKLVGYQRGSRGDFFLWADTDTNATFPMSPRELYEALLKSMPEDGYLEGVWTVVVSNQRYSLRLVTELEEEVSQ